jgi:hypothetical protein
LRQETPLPRSDLKNGLCVDGRPTPAAEAKAFGVNEPVAADDADREAGNVEGFQVDRDIIFEARDQSLDPLFD